MCYRPERSRRWCTVCKDVTSWTLDRSIGHSRCIRCHNTSLVARKLRKNIKEEKKVNKQYVQDQIRIAIEKLRAEYDEKIMNISQCPDCGAVVLKNTEHICLHGRIPTDQPAAIQAKPKRKTIGEHILSILPDVGPCDDIVDVDSVYTKKGLAARVVEAGYKGSAQSVEAAITDLLERKLITRKPSTVKVMSTSKKGNRFPKEISSFVYWRSA